MLLPTRITRVVQTHEGSGPFNLSISPDLKTLTTSGDTTLKFWSINEDMILSSMYSKNNELVQKKNKFEEPTSTLVFPTSLKAISCMSF